MYPQTLATAQQGRESKSKAAGDCGTKRRFKEPAGRYNEPAGKVYSEPAGKVYSEPAGKVYSACGEGRRDSPKVEGLGRE